MIRYDIYPDMKRRCITLCFGVGHVNDERLADLLKEYQLKASFCSNEKEEHIDKISGKHLEKEIVLENVHYKEALNLCDVFLNNMKTLKGNSILHIWGNSNELVSEQEWEKLRRIFEKISGNKNIWYANQDEAYQYVVAQKELVIDMDETCFYNPTTTDIWIQKDNVESMCIPSGRKMILW